MTDVGEALERLRERFVARAAADLGDLRRWRSDPVAHQKDLLSLLHRLAGAAGTFGFHRLSEVAAKAEDALVTDAPDRLATIAAVVVELQAVSEQAEIPGG